MTIKQAVAWIVKEARAAGVNSSIRRQPIVGVEMLVFTISAGPCLSTQGITLNELEQDNAPEILGVRWAVAMDNLNLPTAAV